MSASMRAPRWMTTGVVVALGTLHVGPLRGEAGPLDSVPVPPISRAPEIPQDTIDTAATLRAAADGFAEAFALASSDRLSELLAPDGVRLQVAGTVSGGLSSRQAVASLLGLLRSYDGNRALVSRASALDGSPDRAFAEIQWSARAAGTSDAMAMTLFLSLHLAGGEWRVDEVRLLR